MSEYAERDLETLGQYYTKHLQAMTDECLHSKADIAAELAARDIEILRQRAVIKKAAEMLEAMTDHYCNLANSGDCGFWNADAETIVMEARAIIKEIKGGGDE